jgi:catechol 2,3-dioxygenase-like lactoylglutathione lyase family enzyme
MPQLNHFSLVCEDAENLRRFYARWFGFEELGRGPGGAIYLTDGYFSMGLLPEGSDAAEGNGLGLNHVGFQIESIDEVERRLRDFDPAARIEELPKGGYAEYRVTDPEGLTIDLSEEGWGAGGEKRVPGIRHLATVNKDAPRAFAFYQTVFGMKDGRLTEEETRAIGGMWERAPDTQVYQSADDTGKVTRLKWDRATRSIVGVVLQEEPRPIVNGRRASRPYAHACDGSVNLALLGSSDWLKPNLNHFGLLVRDSYGLLHRIHDEAGLMLDQRPEDRPFAEYRVWDPEGNAIDLSERKGYKVDVDRTDRVED